MDWFQIIFVIDRFIPFSYRNHHSQSFFSEGMFSVAMLPGNFWIAGLAQIVVKALAALEDGPGNLLGTSIAMGNFVKGFRWNGSSLWFLFGAQWQGSRK
mmetsp:Transcript_6220/g.15112  ORF Transcript_6220/g.15112 Transcript_6220/m.15112 type:complete len:99 (-) Transcript_6220:1530-1826(-)